MDNLNYSQVNRRQVLTYGAAGATTALLGSLGLSQQASSQDNQNAYTGPNIFLIRFGGGVRRQETIQSDQTYAPYFLHTLVPQGTFYPNMEIDQMKNVSTSHGEGTLYLLTGQYQGFKKAEVSEGRFEPIVPTLFEYFRKQYQIQAHETLLINGEDRTEEEFYSFSNHHMFGINYSSQVLSLYRFKVYLLRQQLQDTRLPARERARKQKELEKLEQANYRTTTQDLYPAPISQFWDRWQQHYGATGLVNPRGDRLLAELTVWAIKYLRPKLVMVNFQDPDYVHWGYASHYLNGISIIDQGIQRIVKAVAADPEYRDNTIFCIVPDCGRDSNLFLPVPYQHHFNSRSAHEVFALLVGPGIQANQIVDRRVSQIDITPTLAQLMQCSAEYAKGQVLEEVFV